MCGEGVRGGCAGRVEQGVMVSFLPNEGGGTGNGVRCLGKNGFVVRGDTVGLG